jgi:hypothetical protein
LFWRPFSIAFLLLFGCQTMAAEVKWLKVKRKDGRIDIRAEVVIDAPQPEVYDALLDYDQLAELSEAFTESGYIEPAADGAPRVYTKIEGCIWFFCRTVERYAKLELQPKWQITAIAEPELSDADLSIESWTLRAEGDSTLIDYSLELEPGFWVPPLIGVWVIKGTMKRSARDTATRIEALALASLAQNAFGEPDSAAIALPANTNGENASK